MRIEDVLLAQEELCFTILAPFAIVNSLDIATCAKPTTALPIDKDTSDLRITLKVDKCFGNRLHHSKGKTVESAAD
jgi:hypothetical protein